MEKESNLYVIEVDMENRSPEDIAKDAALQIIEFVDRLVDEKKKQIEKS